MARPDPMLERIEAFNRGRGGGVVVRRPPTGTRSTVNARADRSPASSRPARTTRSACWPGTVRNGGPVDRSASQP